MAIINQTNTTGLEYDSGENDISTSYWSWAFGDSIIFQIWVGSPSSIWQKNPVVRGEFWRYSISTSTWVQLDNLLVTKNTGRTYSVRCNEISSNVSYDGDDSYLFAFKAYQEQGERSRCKDRIRVYNVGTSNIYNSDVKGKYIYGRSLDYAYRYHLSSSGPTITLTDSWLTTAGLRGTKITTALKRRMISVKSAISKT
jgi:hypothetical protein